MAMILNLGQMRLIIIAMFDNDHNHYWTYQQQQQKISENKIEFALSYCSNRCHIYLRTSKIYYIFEVLRRKFKIQTFNHFPLPTFLLPV